MYDFHHGAEEQWVVSEGEWIYAKIRGLVVVSKCEWAYAMIRGGD